jgi:myo-inosose-2 dehydratase
MKVRLGINPIGWSNDDLRSLGGDTPLETCLAEAKEAGFSGIELGHKFPRVSGELAPILERHGLDLVSGWYSTGLLTRDVEAELDVMQPHLDLLEDMGCHVVIVAEGTGAIHGDRSAKLSNRPVMSDAQWPEFGRRLTQLGDATALMGLTLVYHHHMGTVVQTSGEIDALMDETGKSVKLLLDTGHATFAGADPVRLARRHAGRIGHVHCKDVRETILQECLARDASFLDAVVAGVFTVPGAGVVDFEGVFAAIPDYQGWLVVEAEQDPAKAHPLTFAKLGRENLARLVRGR